MQAHLRFLILGFIGFSFVARADALDDKALIDKMKSEIAADIAELDRPLTTFNYSTRKSLKLPDAGPVDAADPRFREHLENSVRYFWDLGQRYSGPKNKKFGQTWSNGFYLALDPVSTQKYGLPNYGLFIVKLQKGLKYLRIGSRNWSAPVRQQLEQRGCTGDQAKSVQTVVMSNILRPCREIGLKLLAELNVDFLEYFYMTGSITGCEQPNRAILVVHETAIPAEDAQIVFAEQTNEAVGREERALIRGVIQMTTRSNWVVPVTDLWPAIPPAEAVATKQWMRTNIRGCEALAE